MRLAVELYGTRVGTLTGDARRFDFAPNADGIDRFGTGSPILSVAIPLVGRPRRDHAARRRNWFDETLATLRAVVQQETPLDGAFPLLQEQILGFVDNLRLEAR